VVVMDAEKKYTRKTLDDIYESIKKLREDIPRFDFEKERYEPKKEKIVRIKTRESIPRKPREEMKPIKRETPLVIGDLFDRIIFLKERINEVEKMLDLREKMHEEIMKEVETDIKEKEEFVRRLSEIDDIRDFKLDISMLRTEKRREEVQFWRDMLELMTELQELKEQFQMETKISDLFKGAKTTIENIEQHETNEK